MPTLTWIGKDAVVNHHQQVPFHLLEEVPELGAGDRDSGNLLVEGDNLLALKALLPYYAGKVKCIYIDPPYNTGNEGWAYNDNVNSPEMRTWLGKVVGGEGETLDRHDRWLCMMYPRLVLLREMLAEDGVIFVSIGVDEVANALLMMNEVFGPRNQVAVAVWETAYTSNQTARHISDTHDYVLIYGRSLDAVRIGKMLRTEEQVAKFRNPDNDPRGPWKAENLSAGRFYSAGQFPIEGPTGKVFNPPPGRYWRCNREQFDAWVADSRITFGKDGSGRPMLKKYLQEMNQGLTPSTWWAHTEFGTTKEASLEVKELFGGRAAFQTPKPTRLLKRVLQIATDPDSLILDSFAGSGTTGHAVMSLNAEDGGRRRFILVEMDPAICRDVTAERLRRVSQGYRKPDGASVEGLGSGFRGCRLGARCFDERGRITPQVTFRDLARHLFFTETGTTLPPGAEVGASPLIGVHNGTALYLLYNGVLGDRRPVQGNVLTSAVLAALPPHDGPRVVYGDACRLSPVRCRELNLIFRQIPYDIKA